MAEIKISALPAAATGQTTDIHVLVQAGVTSRQTTAQLLAPITAAYTASDLILQNDITTLQVTKAPIASPTFTGIPAAPTAGAGTATTQIATTAFTTTADLLRLRLSGIDLMTGNLQMNNNKITGITAGTTGTTEAVNVVQMETADAFKPSVLTNYNPTITGAFPTTGVSGGTIKKGDRYYITNAGTMASGTISVGIGDIIEARINSATNVAADWSTRSGGVSSVTASSPLASSGGTTPNITISTVPVSLGGTGQTSLGTSGQLLRVNAGATGTEWATISGTGTVTSVTSVPGDGVTINISNPSTTPLLTVDLGAITPTSVNGLIITPTTYTLTVSGDTTVYGLNTGDQLNVIGGAGFSDTSTIVNDNSTNSVMNIVWTTTILGNLPLYVSSTGLRFNPSTQQLGIGVASPGAVLQLKAGTAAATTAPLKFTSGTNLTSPENGTVEYDGTNLHFTSGGARKTVICSNSVNSVSPTAPNRTITVNIGGTLYYIHAKTSND